MLCIKGVLINEKNKRRKGGGNGGGDGRQKKHYSRGLNYFVADKAR